MNTKHQSINRRPVGDPVRKQRRDELLILTANAVPSSFARQFIEDAVKAWRHSIAVFAPGAIWRRETYCYTADLGTVGSVGVADLQIQRHGWVATAGYPISDPRSCTHQVASEMSHTKCTRPPTPLLPLLIVRWNPKCLFPACQADHHWSQVRGQCERRMRRQNIKPQLRMRHGIRFTAGSHAARATVAQETGRFPSATDGSHPRRARDGYKSHSVRLQGVRPSLPLLLRHQENGSMNTMCIDILCWEGQGGAGS
ncbi:hypothetical protein PG991_008190 [Apiospora marii]|uniref:Uncharacterized protein n=1 Tax=Apiospora marii TaxID=335849 RepID=A0ABR1RVL6_9PEZI